MYTILIVETENKGKMLLAEALSGQYHILFCTPNIKSIENKTQASHVDVVVIDFGQNGFESSLDLLGEIKIAMPFTPIIVTGESRNAENIVAIIKQGAFDYLLKPLSIGKMKVALEKALENVSLKYEIDYLRREQDVIYNIDKIVAESSEMKKVVENIRRFARTDSTILMTGETGTGKSLLSGAIHFNSTRRKKPFVKINCANIQETLLESELFGHEKGAFTGADKLRIGRFEQANGGSIFLDEIGEMSQTLQSKLLRVLEEKCFERVGGNKTIQTDARIIAATNRNLDDLVSRGDFREDLYYRINVLPINLPPLRHRKECLLPLANSLLQKLNRALRKKIRLFGPEVKEAIKFYDWPGNIRQLSNTIERAVLLEEGEAIGLESFVIPGLKKEYQESNFVHQDNMSLLEGEKNRIIQVLKNNLWIQKDAAKILDISPRMLNYKIKKYAITHPRWRKNR